MAISPFTNPPPGLALHASRTASNNAIGIVLFVLSAVFVGLRVFMRWKFQRLALGLDDHLMNLGLALNAGNLACCIAGGFYGLGKHIYILTPYDMRKITIITFAYVFIYAWSVCIIKFSILSLYRRIFGMTYLGWMCVFLTTGYLVTNHVILPLYTQPLNYYWNQWYGTSGWVRVNEAKFYLGVGILNLIGDVCILAVPVRNVWKLQMSKTQKVAVSFIFLLGSFVCFASLYSLITIIHLSHTTDISYFKSDVFIWSSVEPSIGIISGCLPTLRPLLLHILGWFGYKNKSKGTTGGGSGNRSGVSGGGGSGSAGRITNLETNMSNKRQRTRDVPGATGINYDADLDDDEEEEADGGRPCRQMSIWRADEENQITTTVSHGSQQDDEKTEGKAVHEPKHCAGDEGCEVKVTSNIAWGSEQR